ncbi:MAG: PEGA domain-containing protein [Myxococcales bacterium]|nr:PEGA domain-containing protein [Myxococcales bacterium]
MLKLRNWLMTGAALCALSFVSAESFAQAKPKPAPAKPAPKGAAKPDADPQKPNLAEAKARYGAGEAKYKAGDFAGALVEFQAADGIKATPQAARYLGLCQDKLGKLPEAVSAYERFLADVPAKLQPEVDGIKKRVEEIKATPGKVRIETVPAGAAFSVDGKPAQSAAEIELSPGKHALTFRAEGREAAERTVDVTFASKQDLKVELKELPPPPPVAKVETPPPAPATPAPPPPEPRSLVPAFITGGLAVAAAGVGTAFGVLALGDKSDFDKTPSAEKADDGENHALIADMAFGVAITMGVTSAVLFLTRDEPAATKAARNKSRVMPAATRGGGGALIRF